MQWPEDGSMHTVLPMKSGVSSLKTVAWYCDNESRHHASQYCCRGDNRAYIQYGDPTLPRLKGAICYSCPKRLPVQVPGISRSLCDQSRGRKLYKHRYGQFHVLNSLRQASTSNNDRTEERCSSPSFADDGTARKSVRSVFVVRQKTLFRIPQDTLTAHSLCRWDGRSDLTVYCSEEIPDWPGVDEKIGCSKTISVLVRHFKDLTLTELQLPVVVERLFSRWITYLRSETLWKFQVAVLNLGRPHNIGSRHACWRFLLFPFIQNYLITFPPL